MQKPIIIPEVSKVFHMDRCASTNSVSWEKLSQSDYHNFVTVCNEQTNGRGRRENNWFSTRDGSLTFSLAIRNMDNNFLSRISILTGVAIIKAIQKQCAVKPLLKWPNDIFLGNKKLGGILIETQMRSERSNVVIGVG